MLVVRYIVYGFVKLLVIIARRVFFSKISIKGKERLRQKGATILVSNHPNTLLDPVGVAEHIPMRMVHFLGNAGMFQTKISNWFFSTFFVIPIQRKEDTGDRKFDNKKSFARVSEFLTKEGIIYIAPEGGSDIPRRLRPLKTGTARLGLAAEAENDFNLDLVILPVGLNYTDQQSFRSELYINVGEVIDVKNYKEDYEQDSFKAAKKLTADIDERMRALIIDTKDDDEDSWIRKVEEICQAENHLPFNKVVPRTQKLLRNWRTFQEEDPQEAIKFSNAINQYFSFLEKNKTPDRVAVQIQNGNQTKWWIQTLMMIIGFPFFIYGWVNNFLANYIPALINQKLKLHKAYSSCVKSLAGLFTYPIFYGLQIWLVKKYAPEEWMVWAYMASVLILGIFAWWYKDFAKDTISGLKFSKQKEKGTELRKSIVITIKEHLLSKLEMSS